MANVHSVQLEVCADNICGVQAAVRGGAARVELCAGLEVGGLTPSLGAVRAACQLEIPVHVLIRCRAGDFEYRPEEVACMAADMQAFSAEGVSGFVIGALEKNKRLNRDVLIRLRDASNDLPLTLHRAFDLTQDKFEALEFAIELGCKRVLTSGGASDALSGIGCIERLIEHSADRIVVMPGGGVTPAILPLILQQVSVSDVHASCQSAVRAAPLELQLGASPESARRETDEGVVRAMVEICKGAVK